MKTYDLKVRIPEDLLGRIQKMALEAEKHTKEHIPVEAVVLLSVAKGIRDVEYEMSNQGREVPKLRLVK